MNEILNYIPSMDKITTPSKRSIYRHPNNEGSVVEFTMYGREMSMFVADSKYFQKLYRYSMTNSFHRGPAFVSKIPNSFFPNNAETISAMDDDTLGKKLGLSSTTAISARDDCTSHLENFSSPGINYTRSLTLIDDTGCDIPNIYELYVILIEADYIQKLDPSYSPNNAVYIGYNKSKKRRWGSIVESGVQRGYASCTHHPQYSNNYLIDTYCALGTVRMDSNQTILPIREI